MKSFLTLCSLGPVWLAPFTHAYGIHNSCSDENLIQTAADSAISMAANALAAIQPPDGAARDQNVERLLDILFRGPKPLSEGDENLLMRRIVMVFQGVTKFAGNTGMVAPANDPVATDGVNIYCDLNRVIQRNDGTYADSSSGYIIKDLTESVVTSCKAVSGDLAITWSPESEEGDLFYPSQVTLCPWFYQWGRSQSLQQWSDLRAKSFIATGVIPATTNNGLGWPFTPIDAVNLLDKVLLHEFTHTHACGGLHDVKMDKGGAPYFGVAYGWNAATNLAAQQNPALADSPAQNSDSYALFASGVRLLNQLPAVYITDNGKTTSDQPTKRDVPVELQYKRTPAEFEGFITKILSERASATAA